MPANHGEQGSSAEFEHVVSAHARHYSELAAREGPRLLGDGTQWGQNYALQLWQFEAENMLETVDSALRRRQLELLMPIARWLVRYYELIGNAQIARERYALLLAAVQQWEMPPLELVIRVGLSRAQRRTGHYSAARQTATAAEALAVQLGDSAARADLLADLGVVEVMHGNYDKAEEQFSECLAIREELDDRSGQSAALVGLGYVEENRGNYEWAGELFERSRVLRHELHDRHGEATSLNCKGAVAYRLGDIQLARALHASSLACQEEIGDRSGVATSLCCLGHLELSDNRFDAAGQYYARSLSIQCDLGEQAAMVNSCGHGAAALAGLGRIEEAAIALQGTLAVAQRLDYHFEAVARPIVEETQGRLAAAIAEGQVTVAELRRWQVRGNKLGLNQLAEFTLRALDSAGPAAARQEPTVELSA